MLMPPIVFADVLSSVAPAGVQHATWYMLLARPPPPGVSQTGPAEFGNFREGRFGGG